MKLKYKVIFLLIIVLLALFAYNWRNGVVVLYGYSPKYCSVRAQCGELWGIDCYSAADGPYDYVHIWTGKVISECGGKCMFGCSQCPPKEWTCN